jgi:hypothetical protein
VQAAAALKNGDVMMWNRSANVETDDQETQMVTAWLKKLSAVPVTEAPLPDPTYLWWKAELLRRWDAQQRVIAPIEIGEQVQMGVGVVAAAGLLVWLWRSFPDIVTTTPTTSLAGASVTMGLAFTVVLLAATAAVMVSNVIRRN